MPDFLQPREALVRPFPREAVAAAISRKEEATPHLLHALEWADQHTDEANDRQPPCMLHLFALFLLAQFRETRAYPLIAHLARNPQFEPLTGEVRFGEAPKPARATRALPGVPRRRIFVSFRTFRGHIHSRERPDLPTPR